MIANLLTRGTAKNDPNFGEFHDKVLALIWGNEANASKFPSSTVCNTGPVG